VRTAPATTKRLIALILTVLIVAALVLAAATSGLGHEDVPSGDVAVVDGVDNGTVTQADLDTALQQTATQQEVPPADDPSYEALLSSAMQTVLFPIWVDAEASERGITVDDAAVDAELESQKKANNLTGKAYQKYLKSSNLTDEQVREQLRLQLVQDELAKQVVPSNADPKNPDFTDDELADIYGVDDDAISAFYDANKDDPAGPFAITASRDVRVILNSSQGKAAAAKAALEKDDSDASWKKVAAQYSQDQASKDRGGLLQGLVEGSGDPQLEAQVFAAAQGELVGPFKTDRGYYVVQVVSITEAGTQPLDENTKNAIRQQLITNRQQQKGNDFRSDFIDKWTARTTCAPADAIQLCRNYDPPAAAPVAGQPLPAPVQSTRPIEPGTGTITPDGTAQQGLPQAPQGGPAPAAPAGLPAGTQAIGPSGATAPQGAAPSTAAPSGAAPPTP
jgi:parvulin-like peptidyl-prolyl isomerase